MDLVRDVAAITGGSPEKLRKVNLFETSRFFCDVYVLTPGQSQTPHAHSASDKIYAVLSGTGAICVGAARYEVRAGHAVLCPASSEHGVENTGRDDLRLLVFMAPHPKPPVSVAGLASGS